MWSKIQLYLKVWALYTTGSLKNKGQWSVMSHKRTPHEKWDKSLHQMWSEIEGLAAWLPDGNLVGFVITE